MNPKNALLVLSLSSLLVGAAAAPAQQAAGKCAIEISEPHTNEVVQDRIDVKGTATLPHGHHLWIFARRVDFRPDWWPQGEAAVDLETHEWSGPASIGEDRDAGKRFDLIAAVFAAPEHEVLLKQLAKGRHYPMPTATCAAASRIVRRASSTAP
jgi:hypothetical protein